MAIAPRLITLNLGSQTIGLAEFRMQAHGGLVLLDYRLREISTDPTSEEGVVFTVTEWARDSLRSILSVTIRWLLFPTER
jgi:hypothetical protein